VAHSNNYNSTASLHCLKSWLLANPAYHGALDLQPLREYDELYGSDETANSAAAAGGPLNMELHEVVTKLFVDATKANPQDAEVWTVVGLLYRLSSDFDQSIAAFREAIKLRPDDPQMWNKLGAMITNSGENSEEAIAAFNQAVRLHPKYVRALSNMGVCYYNERQYEESVDAFLRCLAINDEPTHLWGYIRMSLSKMGREDLALVAREQNVELLQRHLYGDLRNNGGAA